MVGRLIGRVKELDRVRTMLVDGGQWLVTLWGPAGIGKTSVAIAAAAACAGLPGGSVFCPLEGARSVHDVVKAIGQALDLTAADALGEDEAIAQIGRAVAARGATLIVLDNAEQVVGCVARTVTSWHTQAPELRLLVTSRELLGVPGEASVEIPPLGLPCDDDDDCSDAVELLLDRARAVQPDLAATRPVLRRIVERLDGIPLAIELAAARLSVLSADQLLARLDRRFDVLARTHGGGERRQRTLRGALDWSWDLLGTNERRVLADLSVFHGGFDLAAVEAILGGDVLDALVALRHKSLVAASLLGAHGDSPPRFRLLESVREYAAEHLESRANDVINRHARWYVTEATSRAGWVDQAGGAEALAWLAREQHNVLAVVHAFLASPSEASAPLALDALVAIEPVLSILGPVALLAELLTRALSATARFDVPAACIARAKGALGRAHLALGQLTDAEAALAEATRLVDDASDLECARLTNALGDVKYTQGLFVDAQALQLRSLALAERAGALREQGLALTSLGVVHHILLDASEARTHYERALEVHARVGNLRAEAQTRAHLGFLLQDLGSFDAAAACFDVALATARQVRSRGLEGILLGYIGNVMRGRGELAPARAHYADAMTLLRAAGDRRFLACVTMYDGIALLLDRRPSDAREVFVRATVMAARIGDTRLVALIAAYEASAHAGVGDAAAAQAAIAHGHASTSTAAAREVVDLHDACVGVVLHDQIDRARTILAAVTTRPPQTDHLRIARELLARAIDARAPPDEALVVTDGCGHLRPPEAPWVDLSTRPVLRRLLQTLIEHRLRAPGAAVTTEALVGVGWPGERVVRAAGANRLRVAVATLRASGMKDVLKRSGEGYLLDATVRIVRLDGAPPAGRRTKF